MKLKIGFFLLCMLGLLAANTYAQPGKGRGQGLGRGKGQGAQATPEQRATAQTNRLAKQLDLTADQQTQVKQMKVESLTQHDQLTQQFRDAKTPQEKQTARQAIKRNRDDHESKLMAMLNDTQKTKLQQMRRDAEARAKERRGARQQGKGPKGKPAKSEPEEDKYPGDDD